MNTRVLAVLSWTVLVMVACTKAEDNNNPNRPSEKASTPPMMEPLPHEVSSAAVSSAPTVQGENEIVEGEIPGEEMELGVMPDENFPEEDLNEQPL